MSEPIPEGHVVVRFRVEGEVFEVSIPREERDNFMGKLEGTEVLASDGSIDIDVWHRDMVEATSSLPGSSDLGKAREYVAKVGQAKAALARGLGALDTLADLMKTPRLRQLRGDFDLPGQESQKPSGPSRADKERERRKAKKKAAEKARKKNRRK